MTTEKRARALPGIQEVPGAWGKRYRVRVEVSRDPVTGKRRWKSDYFRTKKEAETARAQWLVERDRGTILEPTKMTVGEYLEYWLAATQASLRPSTYRSYSTMVRTHISPAIGTVPLQKLTALHLQRFYAELQTGRRGDGKEGTLSKRTVQYAHTITKQALKQAMQWDYINRNPADKVTPPRAPRAQAEYWDEQEAAQFLKIAEGETYSPIWLVAFTTGMRKQELLDLRWGEVDMTR
jgi:integrase